MLDTVDVEYVTLPGWKSDISRMQNIKDLPPNALAYIKFIESYLNVSVSWVGVGPGREAMLKR